MDIEYALAIIDALSVDDLMSLNKDELMFIVSGLNEEERSKFFIMKNIKIFGGINEYINDFLEKTQIAPSATSSTLQGIRTVLHRISQYPGITQENKNRIQAAIQRTMNGTAPAAGGRRKNTRKRRSLR